MLSLECPRPVARTYGEDDIQVALVFYSTFKQLGLPGSGPMDKRDMLQRPVAAENDIDWAEFGH
jgi:hypothetical protein